MVTLYKTHTDEWKPKAGEPLKLQTPSQFVGSQLTLPRDEISPRGQVILCKTTEEQYQELFLVSLPVERMEEVRL